MFCANCGKEYDGNHKVCDNCSSMLISDNEENDQVTPDEIPTESKEYSLTADDIDTDDCEDNDEVISKIVTDMPLDKNTGNYNDEKKSVATKNRRYMSGFTTVASFIGLVALINVFVLSFILSQNVKADNFKNTFYNMDVLDLKVGEIVNSDDFTVEADDTVKDIIYKAAYNCTDIPIEKNDIDKIYTVTTLDAYFADKMGQYVNYVFGGNKPQEIDADEIYYYINNHKADIEKIIEKPIESEQMKSVADFLVDYDAIDAMNIVNIDNALEKSGIEQYDQFLQPWVRNSIIALSCILSCVLILIIMTAVKNKSKALGVVGAVFMVSALPLIALSLIAVFAKTYIRQNIAEIGDIVSAVSAMIGTKLLLASSILFSLGVVISVISYALRKRNKLIKETI